MMTRKLCGSNHYNKSSFADRHVFAFSKSKQVELEEKMEAYFNHHPLVLWAIAFVGLPIGILLAVGIAATIFGMVILGIMALM